MLNKEWCAVYTESADRYEQAKILLAELICNHDEMVLRQAVFLEAQYLGYVGELKQQRYFHYVHVEALKRKIELLQSYLDRGLQPDMEQIGQTLQKEFGAYEDELQKLLQQQADAEYVLNQPQLSPAEEQRLKAVYLELTKALNPELHPRLSKEDWDLWVQVRNAYEVSDLDKLDTLWELVKALRVEKGEETIRVENPNRQDLDDMGNWFGRTMAKIIIYKDKLRDMEDEYPFTLASVLADPEQLEMEQNELQVQITEYEEEIIKLRNTLRLLEIPDDGPKN